MAGPPPYVAVADPTRWVVKRGSPVAGELRRLGFSRWMPFVPFEAKFRHALPFEQMGALAGQLRDRGVTFSAGRDWSPSEVVQFLRDEGHFTGSFTEIAWVEDGAWVLRNL